MMLEPEKLQNKGKQGWPDAGKGTGHKGDKKVNTLVRHKWMPIEQAVEFSFLRMRCSHCHKHIYVQVPACTQGVLMVPPTLWYRKRSTNNVSCSLLRLAPQCLHSLVINPWRMHHRVMVLDLCVRLCVCYRASGYIPGLYVQCEVIYSFL